MFNSETQLARCPRRRVAFILRLMSSQDPQPQSASRRRFLAAGASLGATLGLSKLGLAARQDDDRKVGFAVVGLGGYSMGQMLPNFKNTEHCKPVALVTGEPDTKGKKVAGQYGIDPGRVCTYDQMVDRLKDDPAVQVVYVVTPTGLHVDHVLKGFQAGKHVLCEKPMATDEHECDRMIQAGKDAGKKLMIGYRAQYEPYNLRAVEWARQGKFGPVRHVDAQISFNTGNRLTWRNDPKLNGGGGPLMDLGIYSLQAARYITGEEPTSLTATVYRPEDDKRFPPGVESRVEWTFQFPGGATATCGTAWDMAGQNMYRVVCEKGVYELEPATPYGGHWMFVVGGQGKRDEVTDIEPGNQFAAMLDHMAECVMNDKQPKTPGEEGRRDVYLMKRIYEFGHGNRGMKV